jgi:hypothetical protein
MIKYYREGTNVNSFCGISFVSLCGYAALLLDLCGVGLRDALEDVRGCAKVADA